MKKIFSALIVLVLVSAATSSSAATSIKTAAQYAYIIDDGSNTVLFDKNGAEAVPPSSMSKLMTLYMLFDRIKSGIVKLDDTFLVSKKAWQKKGSKMFVGYNTRISVEDLIRGIIVQSGNDACIVVAEGVSGSEEAFVEEMNEMAQTLGLKESHFTNSTGWPNDEHVMSVRDLATLSSHLIADFPEYYHYFKETEYTYNGIKQYNRNVLLLHNENVDGLKTGHTEAAGYGIVISGKKKNRRLIVALNGMSSKKERAQEAERLLTYGFRNFENIDLFSQGEAVHTAEVWFGDKKEISLVAPRNITLTVPKNWNKKHNKAVIRYQSPLLAPIQEGDQVAELVIESKNMPAITIPLVAGESTQKLSGLSHLTRALRYYLMGY